MSIYTILSLGLYLLLNIPMWPRNKEILKHASKGSKITLGASAAANVILAFMFPRLWFTITLVWFVFMIVTAIGISQTAPKQYGSSR